MPMERGSTNESHHQATEKQNVLGCSDGHCTGCAGAKQRRFLAYLPESIRAMAVLMWPVLMIALREVTTKSVSDK